jgi:hypothetical protein
MVNLTKSASVAEIEQQESNYIASIGGYNNLGECNNTLNNLNVEKAAAFYAESKGCYVGKYHYGLCRYEGQKVYTFDFNFMIPVYDKTLDDMLPSTNEHFDAIWTRINELGGITFIWT